jgi:hypothetical protein
MLMVTDAEALKVARNTDFRTKRNRMFMIVAFVIGFLIWPPVGFCIGCCVWAHLRKNEPLQEEAQREAKLRLVDVRKAQCSFPQDDIAIRQRIRGHEDKVNSLIRSFIPEVTAGKKPPSYCFRAFCPPCSVLLHQGPGFEMVLAFFMCSWFTVCCWKPTVYPGAERRAGELYEPPKQQTMAEP